MAAQKGTSLRSGAGENEQATAEQLLRLNRDSPGLLRFLVDSLPVLIAFVDAQGRYRFVNKTYGDWFGRSRAEVIGQSVRHVVGEEAYRVVEDKLTTALAGQEVRFEDQIPFRDGGTRHVDAYYVPQFDAQGNVLGFVALVIDITKRKRAEEARERLLHDLGEPFKELGCMYGVAESVRKRETLAEIFRDVAALLPPGWHYPEITRGRVRFDGEDYVSEPFEETEWRQSSDIVVNGGRRGIVEVYYLEERPELDEGPFMTQERNLIEGIAYALGEAIERRQAEEETRQVQEKLLGQQRHETERVETELAKVQEELVRQTRLAAVGQVSASIAHDLRNPLGSVRNAAFYLKRRLPKQDPEFAEFLGIIDEEVRAADRIISNLLEMTRTRPPSKQPVDLRQFVTETCGDGECSGGVKCRVSTVPDRLEILVDPHQWRQVMANLMNNAAQAMRGRGEFLVEATRGPEFDTILIRDTGPGVAPEVKNKLFEPLVTTKTKGTGLGLTICRHIIERHGGTIDVVDHEGGGAAFQIRLPRK